MDTFNPDHENGIKNLIDEKYKDKELTSDIALQITLEVSHYNKGQLHRINQYKEKVLDFLDRLIQLNNYTKEDLYSVMYHVMISSSLIDYLDNLISDKVGRNEPCPCGSGRKYKQCCIL